MYKNSLVYQLVVDSKRYKVIVTEEDDDGFYFSAKIDELPGLLSTGDDLTSLMKDTVGAIRAWKERKKEMDKKFLEESIAEVNQDISALNEYGDPDNFGFRLNNSELEGRLAAFNQVYKETVHSDGHLDRFTKDHKESLTSATAEFHSITDEDFIIGSLENVNDDNIEAAEDITYADSVLSTLEMLKKLD